MLPRLVICVIFGLVTTVAVAWLCAAFALLSDDPPIERTLLRQDGSLEWRVVQQGMGRSRINYVIGPPAPPGATAQNLIVPLVDAFSILTPRDSGSIEEAGWPFKALSCQSDRLTIVTSTMAMSIQLSATSTPILEGGLALPDRIDRGTAIWRALPCRPLWLGLIFNSILYAAAWFLLLFAFRPLRAWLRTQRGRCHRCGYDLRGHHLSSPHGRGPGGEGVPTGCPECGWNRRG